MWFRRSVLWWRRVFVSVYYYHCRLYNCLDWRCYCRSYNQHGRVFRYRYIHRGLLLLCLLPVLPPSFAGDGDCVAAGKPAVRDHNANVGHTANAAVPSTRELQSAPTRLCSASSSLSKLSAAASPVSSTSSTRPASSSSTSQRWWARQVLEWTLGCSAGVFVEWAVLNFVWISDGRLCFPRTKMTPAWSHTRSPAKIPLQIK